MALHTRGSTVTSREKLETIAGIARQHGCEVATLTGDLGVAGAGAALVEHVVERFGGLDHLVSNAGFADKRPIAELTRGDLDRSLAAMTGAFFEMAKVASTPLKASQQGRVIFVSSFVAHRYVPGGLFPASAAAKAAGEALMRALAAELAPAGVTVNAVVPGYTQKDGGHSALGADGWRKAAEATPLGRIAEPTDIAALIGFLLSPAARHITGQAIAVDGGLSLGSPM
jgi:NAD(P)-dependent dehydrogenase (short-subunit alcohol dehydrogenase family)